MTGNPRPGAAKPNLPAISNRATGSTESIAASIRGVNRNDGFDQLTQTSKVAPARRGWIRVRGHDDRQLRGRQHEQGLPAVTATIIGALAGDLGDEPAETVVITRPG